MSRSHPRDIFHFSHNNKMCHKQAPKSEHSATHGCLFFFAFCNLTVFFLSVSPMSSSAVLCSALFIAIYFSTLALISRNSSSLSLQLNRSIYFGWLLIQRIYLPFCFNLLVMLLFLRCEQRQRRGNMILFTSKRSGRR